MTLILPTLFRVNNDIDQSMTASDRRPITTARLSPPHSRQTRTVDADMSDDDVGTSREAVIHTNAQSDFYIGERHNIFILKWLHTLTVGKGYRAHGQV